MTSSTSISPELHANLIALSRINPTLCDRLCLPVSSSHVETRGPEVATYIVQQERIRLNLLPTEVGQVLSELDGSDVFLFGIGTGELIPMLVERLDGGLLTAWDRDPWLIRMALSRNDVSMAIRTGQLRLSLSSDLLDELPSFAYKQVVFHPLLKQIYKNEAAIVHEGLAPRRALICAGGLFVEDVSESLRNLGFTVFTFDAARLSEEELQNILKRVRPEFIVTINYTKGLSEFCHRNNMKLLCWEIDPSTSMLLPPAAPTSDVHVFTYRRAHVDDYNAAGFGHCEYWPLATEPTRRTPVPLSDEERDRYAAGISFVGSSMMDSAASCHQRIVEAFAQRFGSTEEAQAQAERIIQTVLEEQRKDFRRYIVPFLLEDLCPDLVAAWPLGGHEDLTRLLGEIAGAEMRATCIARLGHHGIRVWGDAGWKPCENFGAQYMGLAGHFVEITKIYCGSLINIDIGRLYQRDIVTMRVFDILACGGFILTDHSDALSELFTIGEELDTYRSAEELDQKVRFYLDHPDLARSMAQRGRERVLHDHTIAARVRGVLDKSGVVVG